MANINIKITLSSGKEIGLSEKEYEELKNHFSAIQIYDSVTTSATYPADYRDMFVVDKNKLPTYSGKVL